MIVVHSGSPLQLGGPNFRSLCFAVHGGSPSKGVKQLTANAPCTGFKPSSAASVSLFCFQQVGLDRLASNGGSSSTGDPTLDIDPSRNGVEPDIVFTGPNDTVAWVLWYEKDHSHLGLRNNEQVFAAKIPPSKEGRLTEAASLTGSPAD